MPWNLITLDDKQPWLTDGNVGFNPDTALEMLETLRTVKKYLEINMGTTRIIYKPVCNIIQKATAS